MDDPLPWRLEDPRRLRRQVHDAVWLRVVDVGRVLGARRYAREGRLVVEVKDAFCPWNQGRYALESGPDGAECRRTQAEAGVRLDAVDLAAAYMGAVRLSTLARAGRVEASSEAALRSAEEMFVWHVAPWCPEVF
ncbi:MAG: sterol carrier protein domain-containing protein [Gemmatimonadetes bacterium]|nr:sterol carrier protein domain-containing protein [Gemmatimonadota bacterium]